mmetsp:Transcript_13623/g.20471  ORF Transcript_13623/g.20471 Transcript_13623/m.20471 type:complete len:680 (+) Transcript_13623:287-2326(+)
MTADWPTIDPSVDDGEHTSDLFTGDLFSDELLDMYNPVAPMTNILSNEAGEDPNNRGQGMDYDGLGAFGPSNSINDFTSILENNNTILPSPSKVTEEEPGMDKITVHPASVNFTANTDNVPAAALAPVANTVTTSPADAGKKRPRDISQQIAVQPPLKKVVVVNKPMTVVAPAPVASSNIVQPIVQRIVQHVAVEEKDAIRKNVVEPPQMTHVAHITAVSAPDIISAVVTPQVAVHTAPVPTVVKSAPSALPVQPCIVKANHTVASAVKVVPSLHSSDSSCSVGSLKTEESFKGVAQAAVTNLILSAASTTSRKEDPEITFNKPVDTSTAHVAALTSNNWVAACAASISGAPPGTAQAAQAAALAAASDPAAAKAARARRATLTADERASQNRDSKREHANTRRRKKAIMLNELKQIITELCAQRDAADVEKRHEKQRDLEVREVRYRVMEEFLKLRARGAEQNLLARWVAILEDGFSLTLPKVEYRTMVSQDLSPVRRVSSESASVICAADPTKQVLRGANQCFDDAVKVASFIVSAFMGNAVQMVYQCERTNFMMDGVKAILDWTLRATPQTANGESAAPSFVLKGSMRAVFSPTSSKLASAELFFDTGSVAAQIKSIKSQQSFCPVEETNDLLDSLPQVPAATLPSTVSVVSTDKDASSDEEGTEMNRIKAEPQTA